MDPKRTRSGAKAKWRICLVDDHPILREGLAQLLNQQPDFDVCNQSSTLSQALQAIDKLKPDIVLVDIGLHGANGIELIKFIKAKHCDLPTLVLSMHDETLYADRALRAGARGYIMKQSSVEEVIEAVRKVLRGEKYLSRQMQERMIETLGGKAQGCGSRLEHLSDRELEVFQAIGSGLGTREIAERLKVSIKTVETHRAHLKEKLGVHSGLELIRLAVDTVGKELD